MNGVHKYHPEKCSIAGCMKVVGTLGTRGLCCAHYAKLRRNGKLADLTLKDRFLSKIEMVTETGCWIWMGTSIRPTGYGAIHNKNKKLLAHRVSWELFRGSIPKRMLVCHHCDTKLCVNPHHLFLGTYLDNERDKIKKNRRGNLNTPRGELHHKAKITEDDVRRIRSDSRSGKKIAADYGISASEVHVIKQRKFWKHVE